MRTITPVELTDEVLDILTQHQGIANVMVLRGAAQSPAGDVVMADIARESADEVIETLDALGVMQSGSLVLENLDTAIGGVFKQAERVAPGHGDDAVIWADLEQQVKAQSTATWSFFVFLTLATQLAGIAALTDSSVLLVGAMVLGPEFGAIAAISYGVLFGDLRLILRAARLLALGFLLAIAVTFVCAFVSHEIGVINVDSLPAHRSATGFVYSPDRWSFIVALLAGAAGVLSMAASKSSALVGVFISVTTVPAAGNLAVALALGHTSEISGSIKQLFVNIAGMILAGIVTLAVQRFAWKRVRRARVSTP